VKPFESGVFQKYQKGSEQNKPIREACIRTAKNLICWSATICMGHAQTQLQQNGLRVPTVHFEGSQQWMSLPVAGRSLAIMIQ
jgi:hypothetical protein